MPDLNFDHPPLREEVYKIGRFWLDKGIDGFRLDAAKHIYPDDRLEDTRSFWKEFTERMRVINPDVKIIGEVWSDPQTLASFFKGLPSLFNFELSKTIPECILTGDALPFITSYQNIETAYRSSNDPFEDAILLSNHDMTRIRSTLSGDIEKSKLAASILLSLPGTPYIYYGEEIGMLGVKPDIHIREVFPWDETTLQQPMWQESKYSIPPDVVPLSIQKEDPSSLYHHYKKWIKWRNQYPALSSGHLQFIDTGNNSVLAFMLSDASGTVMAIHNLGSQEVTITLPKPGNRIENEMKENSTTTILITGHESMLLLPDQ
jgi:glycosidase